MEQLNINFQSRMIIKDLSFWMDGGSVTVYCENIAGEKIEIEFHQNMSLDCYPNAKIPGRLYINKLLVKVRSDLEKSILENLKSAKLEYDESLPDYHLILAALNEKIEYVQSEQYWKDYVATQELLSQFN
ncbi:hypothetical protein [Aureispira sp. CCB-QB1]|uniref:hypothetical protein n=1 Tax=Aureispira sp. CCB-QB1 TaxID=1313421 RepID=UPI0006967FE3|nr:hypothetical protein [Aureispira sp. CCB-QB1]